MKKITKFLVLLAVVSLFALKNANAQVTITLQSRPADYLKYEGYERNHPPAPTRQHVWHSEEWYISNGTILYKHGFWVLPPYPGVIWISGFWKYTYANNGAAYYWVSGHWSNQ